MSTTRATPLAAWCAVWHPHYRRLLVLSSALAGALAVLAYTQNAALTEFTRAVAAREESHGGLLVPLALLGGFGVLTITRLLTDVWQKVTTGRLVNRARNDLEVQLLSHLLRKDDLFFADRPPGEIMNRLSVDIARINNRRIATTTRNQALLLILANLAFFVASDIRLAAVGFITCVLGTLWMNRITRSVAQLDRGFLVHDDKVKARFEDMLRASTEIQVGRVFAPIVRRFRVLQRARETISIAYWKNEARIGFVNGAAHLVSLLALSAVTLYLATVHEKPDAATVRAAALIPVILRAVPELFTNASALAAQKLAFELAATSEQRLLEYDSGASTDDAGEAPRREGSVAAITLQDVTYRYPVAGGSRHGGITGVSVTFERGRWAAIVGAAGSGKSTLVQVLLGRVAPESGGVRLDDRDASSLAEIDRAALFTLAPQSVVIIDGSLRDNIQLGLHVDADSDMLVDVLQRWGLAEVARREALALRPAATLDGDLAEKALAVRRRLREVLEREGLPAKSFSDGGNTRSAWLLERALGGRCDRARALEVLLGRKGTTAARAVLATPSGAELVAAGRHVLDASHTLLMLASFAAYSRAARTPIDERIFNLRTTTAAILTAEPEHAAPQLVLVALTATLGELLEDTSTPNDTALSTIETLLGDAFVPFDGTRLHPFTTWRDNLLFAEPETASWDDAQIDRLIAAEIARAGLERRFVELGLAFEVGRGGARLSGGQRQLISLCRADMRNTPVVVMDEPTAALDPESRARVGRLLTEQRRERIVITVSHDPELVRHADVIHVMAEGRRVASGTFDDLMRESEQFRFVMNKARSDAAS